MSENTEKVDFAEEVEQFERKLMVSLSLSEIPLTSASNLIDGFFKLKKSIVTKEKRLQEQLEAHATKIGQLDNRDHELQRDLYGLEERVKDWLQIRDEEGE